MTTSSEDSAGEVDGSTTSHDLRAPPWSQGANRRQAFLRGCGDALFSVPALVLCATSIGFGALAREAGFEVGMAVFATAAIYALPAQVIFADQVARDVAVWTAAFAVFLTAIRLLPMAVTLVPYFRGDGHGVLWKLFAVHFVAVTAWVEGHRRLPALPLRLRLHYFIGLGIGFALFAMSGTALGFFLAGTVPTAASAAMLLSTPIYFLLSLLAAVRLPSDAIAIAVGGALGPPLYMLAPSIDLLVAGLVGGSIAWLVAMRGR